MAPVAGDASTTGAPDCIILEALTSYKEFNKRLERRAYVYATGVGASANLLRQGQLLVTAHPLTPSKIVAFLYKIIRFMKGTQDYNMFESKLMKMDALFFIESEALIKRFWKLNEMREFLDTTNLLLADIANSITEAMALMKELGALVKELEALGKELVALTHPE